MPNILVIPDIHIPYGHKRALSFLTSVYKKQRCTMAVCVGDIYDHHAISFHDHDPDALSPGEELKRAKAQIVRWYKAFPSMRVCIGNHDALPRRRGFASFLPDGMTPSLNDTYGTPGWAWANEHVVQAGRHEIIFRHHFAHKVIRDGGVGGCSTVSGHIHASAGIVWSQGLRHSTFSLQVGCLIDVDNRVFAYNKLDARRPVLACGTIVDGQPQIHRLW